MQCIVVAVTCTNCNAFACGGGLRTHTFWNKKTGDKAKPTWADVEDFDVPEVVAFSRVFDLTIVERIHTEPAPFIASQLVKDWYGLAAYNLNTRRRGVCS